MKKIWNIVSSILVGIVVLFAVFLMGSRLVGYQVFNVISGSMEPEYSVGDLIYVKKVNTKDIKVGMPITFVLNEDLVVATHRVIEIDAANQYFYTKGDANETVDSAPVHFNNVIGVPQFSIPLLGYVSDFIQNPPGTYITICVGAILILAVFLPDIIGKSKEEEEEVAEKTEQSVTKTATEKTTDCCVLCGADTCVLSGVPADARKHYINGVGQLCESCYSKVNSQFQNPQ
ncbi:MAG: signal peptidase I [Tyzzerella sp.]|nr:signal peptidase I [Tyzzerella sp.]